VAKSDEPFQKVRPDLPDDPKFIRMVGILRAEPDFAAHVLGLPVPEDPTGPMTLAIDGQVRRCWNVSELVPHGVAAGVLLLGLVRVWGAVYAARTGEVLEDMTIPEIDDLGGVPALGWAMLSVGWADPEPGPSVRFPGLAGFFKNGQAKSNAERCKTYRERKGGQSERTDTKPVSERVERDVATRVASASPVSNDALPTRQEERVKTQDRIDRSDPPAPTPRPAPTPGPGPNLRSRRVGQGRARRLTSAFAAFWSLWPRKENELLASKKWRALAPDAALVETILAAVRAWLPTWAQRDPDHVPQAWGWLENQRWNDKPPVGPAGPRPTRAHTDRTTELAKRSLIVALGGTRERPANPPG
jgi:hypothetical protein